LGEGLAAALHKRFDGLTSLVNKAVQLGRQGEGDHVVGNRQQSCQLAAYPFLGIGLAASWAEPVLATVEGVVLMSARTGIAMPSQGRGAALEDRLESLALIERNPLAVAGPESRREAFDHAGYGGRSAVFPERGLRLPARGHGSGVEDRSDELVDVLNSLRVADRREVGVDRGRFNMGVPQVSLKLVERDPGGSQMRSEAVPQDVTGYFLGDPFAFGGRQKAAAQAVGVHGVLCHCHVACGPGGVS